MPKILKFSLMEYQAHKRILPLKLETPTVTLKPVELQRSSQKA